MRKSTTLATSAAVFSAALLIGCSKKDELGARQLPPAVVEVAKPVKKMQEIWDYHLADLVGEKSVEVRARVNGYLEKINFRDGDYVKAGDLLFKIDPRPFEAVVKECQARVKECEARISLAKSNLVRAEELIKSNAISGEVLETRRAELLSAEAAILSAQAQLREADLNLEFTDIRAPISGYVSKRLVDEGNLVNASTTLLTTIVSRDVIYAYFFISNRDFVRYNQNGLFKSIDTAGRKGPPTRLLTDDGIAKEGVLTYIDNTLNTASVQLRAEFDNKDGSLFPGLFGRVYLRAENPQEKIMVPELAVGTDLVGRYVLTVGDDDIVKYVAVSVGEVVDGMQIVEKGLSGDERVVVNGLQRAIPGSKVSPKEADAKKE